MLLVISLAMSLLAPPPPLGDFRLTMTNLSSPTLHVESMLPSSSGQLLAPAGTTRDPGLWAAMVENLVVEDSAGRAIPVGPRVGRAWQLASDYRGRVHVTYDVNLSFTRRPWPNGNQRAGIERDSALFVVTKPMFLVSDTALIGARVSFAVPSTWRVAAPWTATTGALWHYDVGDYRSLTVNSVVLGRFAELDLGSGPFRLKVALIGAVAREAPLARSVLSKAIATYTALFPMTPRRHALLTMFYYDRDDGEAFAQSSSFVTAHPLSVDGAQIWANTLAHELFHLWNPGLIPPADRAASAWITEGFTEYYANLTLVRGGIISIQTFLDYVGRHLGNYAYFNDSPLFNGASIAQAAVPDKTRGRLGVYDGGWSVALCLDLTIRARSGGQQSLDDVMRTLAVRYPPTGPGYTYADFQRVSQEFIGSDGAAFFAKYVSGTDPLPYESLLATIGLQIEGSPSEAMMFVHLARNSSAAEVAGRKAFLGR